MPVYTYKARDAEGKRVTGRMEAESENALLGKLHQKRLLVLSVARQRQKGAARVDLSKLFPEGVPKIGGKVKLTTLLSFTTQLSAMVSAGLPIVQSLRGLSLDITDKKFQSVITGLEVEVNEGNALSRALERYPQIFNKLFIHLIRAGENSGRLGQILTQLTAYLESQYNLRKKVQSALTYPLVVVSFALIVILFMVLKIIPKFERIYQGFGKELPLPTKILLGISNHTQSHLFLWLFIIIVGAGFAFLFSYTPRGRILFDQIKLKLPVLGPLKKISILSTFSRTLSVLINSGVPLVPAMRLAIQVIDNQVIAQNLSKITDDIERGMGVGDGFRKSGFFPEMMVQMIATGEKTGTIDDMVLKTATFYEKQVEASITTLTTLLEPIIIAVIGLVVGGMMLAMFLPVFKLGGVMH